MNELEIEYDDEGDANIVCHACVGDALLKGEIRRYGRLGQCSYCDDRHRCVPIPRLARRIDPVYRELVRFAEHEPYIRDDSDNVEWIQRGDTPQNLITDLIDGVDTRIAEDVVGILGEDHSFDIHRDGDTDWYDDANEVYELGTPDDPRFRDGWATFCESLKHRRRFFSADAKHILDEILGPILNATNRQFDEAVRTIGPDSDDRFVYRARAANDPKTREVIYSAPISQLGAPPPRSSSAGRMNAAGISVFYGSGDATTCVAELRIPVGGSAVVGKFEIIRPLRFLDLTRLDTAQSRLSVFHPDYVKAHNYAKFIRGFHEEIRRPVIPGEEVLEYLPTQVVAEYLWTRGDRGVDGLIFSSSQVSGSRINIVLFPHACKIEGRDAEQARTVAETFSMDHRYADADEHAEAIDFVSLKPLPEVVARRPAPQLIFEDWGRAFPPLDEAPVTPPSLRFLNSDLQRLTVRAIDYEVDPIPVRFEEERDLPF